MHHKHGDANHRVQKLEGHLLLLQYMEQHEALFFNYTLVKQFLLQSACCFMCSCPEMWLTDCTYLLHICDDISHLQTQLIILLFLILKHNHCFRCVCMGARERGGGWLGGGGMGGVVSVESRKRREGRGKEEEWKRGEKKKMEEEGEEGKEEEE